MYILLYLDIVETCKQAPCFINDSYKAKTSMFCSSRARAFVLEMSEKRCYLVQFLYILYVVHVKYAKEHRS